MRTWLGIEKHIIHCCTNIIYSLPSTTHTVSILALIYFDFYFDFYFDGWYHRCFICIHLHLRFYRYELDVGTYPSRMEADAARFADSSCWGLFRLDLCSDAGPYTTRRKIKLNSSWNTMVGRFTWAICKKLIKLVIVLDISRCWSGEAVDFSAQDLISSNASRPWILLLRSASAPALVPAICDSVCHACICTSWYGDSTCFRTVSSSAEQGSNVGGACPSKKNSNVCNDSSGSSVVSAMNPKA